MSGTVGPVTVSGDRRLLAALIESDEAGEDCYQVVGVSYAKIGEAAFVIAQLLSQLPAEYGEQVASAAASLRDALAGDAPLPPVRLIEHGKRGKKP